MASFALVLAACGGGGPAEDDGVQAPRPQPGVDVQEVTAEVHLDPATLRIDATATLDVLYPDTLQTLVLGLDDPMDVATVRVDGVDAPFRREGDALLVPVPPPAGDRLGLPTASASRRWKSSTAARRRPASTPTTRSASASSLPTAGPTARPGGCPASTTRPTRRGWT